MTRSARWLFLAALMPIAACSNSTPPVAAAPPPPPPLAAVDQSFVTAAASSDAGEIQAAQLAETKSHRAAVKHFAQQMVTDHTASTQKLTTIATSKGVTPPTTPTQAATDQMALLQKASPARFDREYLRDQVMDHEVAVKAFQDEIANGQDADLKQFATDTLPIIQHHLAEARHLAGMRA